MDRIQEHFLVQPPRVAGTRYSVALARNSDDILRAQRLRWTVFRDELGARLTGGTPGIDADRFDPFCEHLVVRDELGGEVVGTYRILSPEGARRAGGYYSETEFDISCLDRLREGLVEVGRSCIHPRHRSGVVIGLLWSGLARYMLASGHRHLCGCASLEMTDGGHAAASVFERLRVRHMAPREFRVFPRDCLPLDELDCKVACGVPPLLRGYLRAGAWICGEPAWDPGFNTADLFVLLPLDRLSARHARHFFGDTLRVG